MPVIKIVEKENTLYMLLQFQGVPFIVHVLHNGQITVFTDQDTTKLTNFQTFWDMCVTNAEKYFTKNFSPEMRIYPPDSYMRDVLEKSMKILEAQEKLELPEQHYWAFITSQFVRIIYGSKETAELVFTHSWFYLNKPEYTIEQCDDYGRHYVKDKTRLSSWHINIYTLNKQAMEKERL